MFYREHDLLDCRQLYMNTSHIYHAAAEDLSVPP